MKNTVKFLVFAILFAFGFETSAQTSGMRGGLNLSTFRTFADGENQNEYYMIKPGFLVGWMMDIKIVDGFSLQTGIDISQKGYKLEVDDDWKASGSLLYAIIPVTGNYTHDFGGVKLYGQTGPYFGVGLIGWYKSEFEGEEDSDNFAFGKDGDFKLLDVGLKFGAGLVANNVDIGVYYDLGLSNIDTLGDKFWITRNRTFGITLGYWFGGKE